MFYLLRGTGARRLDIGVGVFIASLNRMRTVASDHILCLALVMKKLSLHLLAIFLLGGISLHAQHATETSGARPIERPRPKLQLGPQFLSADLDLIFGSGRTWGIFADLDLVRYTSRPIFSLGLRAGWEWADGPELIDYDYDDHHANILGRITANMKWMRVDLYGGYAYVTRTESGFNLPKREQHHHLYKVGGEVRVMVIPRLFGLIGRYSFAGADLFGSGKNYDVGGIGFTLGWQP